MWQVTAKSYDGEECVGEFVYVIDAPRDASRVDIVASATVAHDEKVKAGEERAPLWPAGIDVRWVDSAEYVVDKD